MSKAVLISIRPEWCEKILSGEKTIEIRKTSPKMQPPFKCYIYCTKGKPGIGGSRRHFYESKDGPRAFDAGTVIAEFICDRIYGLIPEENGYEYEFPFSGRDCLSDMELYEYLGDRIGFGWHISDLKIYDEPKRLEDFRRVNEECIWHPQDGVPFCEKGEDCSYCAVRRAPQSWIYVEELK